MSDFSLFTTEACHAEVRDAANRMADLKALYDAGRLTDAQYQELGRNILTLSDANKKLLSVQDRQAIWYALSQIAAIAGIIISILP